MPNENGRKRSKKTEEAIIKRRRRSVLLVMSEVALCLLLGIGAVLCKRTVSQIQTEELSPSVHKESIYSPTYMSKSVEDVTNDSGEVIGKQEIDIPVNTNEKVFRNILLLGVDAGGDNSDVIMIVSVNNITGEIKLVSVLRDTILRMEDNTNQPKYNKANAQYYSGISDAVSMINRNFGLDIEEYVVVNWYGVAVCVNQLGGVEMTIKDAKQLSWFNGYLTEVNNQTGIWAPQLSAPGTYLMSGTQLVAYSRIRYGGLNDMGRTSNQREAINKILEKAKSIIRSGDINTILNAAETGLGNVRTNLKLSEIIYLATMLDDYTIVGNAQFPKNYTSQPVVGNFVNKYGRNLTDCVVANDFAGEVRALHEFLFGDPNYNPSDFVKQISYEMYLDRTGQ